MAPSNVTIKTFFSNGIRVAVRERGEKEKDTDRPAVGKSDRDRRQILDTDEQIEPTKRQRSRDTQC